MKASVSPMETQRLYLTDPYLTHFQARVIRRLSYQGQPAVVLDRTAFYPTSGGQPADRGRLNGVEVTDVLILKEGHDRGDMTAPILHVLAAPIPEDEVTGEVDWNRRFDHMQQHTGQHILSQALLRVARAETLSFHLSPATHRGLEVATIDLNQRRLLPSLVAQAEQVANQIVWENRPVTARIVSPEELAQLPLRRPPAVAGAVRVVEVTDFDFSACGGTHVSYTGEIGIIKVVRVENRGEKTRLFFRCGGRALADYRRKTEILQELVTMLNVGDGDLDRTVTRLLEENRALRRELQAAQGRLLDHEAQELLAAAPTVGPVRLVVATFRGREPRELTALARALIAHPHVVALLGSQIAGTARFCFARSEALDLSMAELVRSTDGVLEKVRGGGRPDFAQGGGRLSDAHQLEAAMALVVQRVRDRLAGADGGSQGAVGR